MQSVLASVYKNNLESLRCALLKRFEAGSVRAYIAVRKSGQYGSSLWLNSNQAWLPLLEAWLKPLQTGGALFELEFLFAPEPKTFNPQFKNQWNSWRGVKAIQFKGVHKNTTFSALQFVANNWSFTRAYTAHIKRTQEVKSTTEVSVVVYDVEQLLVSADVQWPLLRGATYVLPSDVNQAALTTTIKGMSHWLARQVDSGGQATYKYWPSRAMHASSNNAIRQWMATVCLGRIARSFNNKMLEKIAAKNLAFNVQSTFKQIGGYGCIWMDGSAKLGAAALAALAILESPVRQQFVHCERTLNALIEELTQEDGAFDTFWVPRERKDNQNFYSGEALLYLAARYVAGRDPKDLARFMRGFEYYKPWHYAQRNPAFVPWHTQACYLVWRITRDARLSDFIFDMNDWLLSMQQWGSAPCADMQGRFYDPKRAHFGPPHASSTGVYLEGLIDAFSVAQQLQDGVRTAHYRTAIIRGMRSIMQLQFKNTADCFYVKDINAVLGGVKTTVYDNAIRIDNVQHALMAFLKIHARFTEQDFSEDVNSKNKTTNTDQLLSYQYFRRIDYLLSFEVIKKEIKDNELLFLKNTSRQNNIRVQRDTQTVFLRSAKKPLPLAIQGNDAHESTETENAKAYPLLMKTLYAFAQRAGGELGRATVVRLLPGCRVYPHIDEGEYYKYRDRYHIVIQSPSGSEMKAGDETVTWREGEFWWFDNKAMHEAYNRGDDYRVHIIFDILPVKNIKVVEKLMYKTGELTGGIAT
ncbi:aspartyl/asparaginyl beta-hydroxylase domain-containing protein [Marinagarivorans algicola]|uniref:aspartyl/asparaginyl beta-hydroxylase domain-containing protein n=1 Tax=Marinagarivorans algicola TaxID=1513270 RepID=UPI003735F707